MEKVFGKDQDTFKPEELDSYENVLLDLIIDKINKKKIIKRE